MPKFKTLADLKKEVQAKEMALKKLQARRGKVLVRLAAIDKKIAIITGEGGRRGKAAAVKVAAAPKGKRGRRRGRATGKPLAEYIQAVLAKSAEGMRAKDIAEAVRTEGYKTFSKDFYGIVATALRDQKKFKKLSRGVYAAK